MTNPDYTHLALVVDRSGSMSSIASDMNGAIRTLLKEQNEQPGRLVVDVTTFDHNIEFPYSDVAATDAAITADLVVPRGMTALNDAIGVTINRLGAKLALMDEDSRPGHVIVVIVTDGAENSSREYSAERIREMVKEQEEKWNWTFLYLAANVDAFATGGTYGFSRGQTMQYAATAGGTQGVYAAASASITRTRSGLDATFTEDERDSAVQA